MGSAEGREGGGAPARWRERLPALAPRGSAAAAGGGRPGRVGSGRIGSDRSGSDRGRCRSGYGARPAPLGYRLPLAAAGSQRPPRAAGSMAAPAGGLEDAELREAQRDYLDFLDDEVRPGAGLRRGGDAAAAPPHPPPIPRRAPGGGGAPGPCPPPQLGRWGWRESRFAGISSWGWEGCLRQAVMQTELCIGFPPPVLAGRPRDLSQQSAGHDQRQPVPPPRQHQRPAAEEREEGQPVGVGRLMWGGWVCLWYRALGGIPEVQPWFSRSFVASKGQTLSPV